MYKAKNTEFNTYPVTPTESLLCVVTQSKIIIIIVNDIILIVKKKLK